jgi:hypothetical protein
VGEGAFPPKLVSYALTPGSIAFSYVFSATLLNALLSASNSDDFV